MKTAQRLTVHLTVLLAILTFGQPAQAGQWTIKTTPQTEVEDTYLHTFTPPTNPTHDLVFFLAVPPKLAYQPDISAKLSVVGRSYAATEVTEAALPTDSPDFVPEKLRRHLLQIRVPAKEIGSQPIVVKTKYSGTICKQVLDPGSGGSFSLSSEEREFYLKPTNRLDYQNPDFRAWLDQNHLWRAKASKEWRVSFARRVYLFVKEYYLDGKWADGDLPASKLYPERQPSWRNVAVVMAAIFRANEIPARVTCVNLGYTTPYLAHASSCQIFDEQLGWINIEAAVVFYPGRHNTRYDFMFFGGSPGLFVTTHLGTDLNLPLSTEDGGPRTIPWMPGVVNNYDILPSTIGHAM